MKKVKYYPAVIQVRNNSSRLKRKSMLKVLGRPLLFYLLERIKAIPQISQIYIATTCESIDDEIAEFAKINNLNIYRGDSENVLSRICECVSLISSEYFIKFWGDSPIIDPFLCQQIIKKFENRFSGYDYVSNNHPSTYPEGMQIEIIKISTLIRVFSEPTLSANDQEHVTSFIWRNPNKFKIGNIESKKNFHDRYRFVVDYYEDFLQIKNIIEALYPINPLFTLKDMMNFLDTHENIKLINQKYYETEEDYNKRIFGFGKI